MGGMGGLSGRENGARYGPSLMPSGAPEALGRVVTVSGNNSRVAQNCTQIQICGLVSRVPCCLCPVW